jgi:NADH-quinone oxidoreductase subunit J|tara:strand:- start:268 stop:864 length:597 start_codon:yes stop_codon:yes gene_type:complete
MIKELIFYSFSSVLICSSLAVVLFRNPVYSAVSLILSFITSGFLWLLLEAEFLAIVLILVYVGAVMVLFLFVIMMLNINEEKEKSSFNSVAPFAVFIGLIIVAELITIIWINSSQFSNAPTVIQQTSQMGNTLLLGTELFTNYILDFEVAGFILLLAIIVAISLTLRPRKNLKTQVASEQINVDPKKRMKLIDLKDTK